MEPIHFNEESHPSPENEMIERFMQYVDQLESLGLNVQIGPNCTAVISDEKGPFVLQGKTWLGLAEMESVIRFAEQWTTEQVLKKMQQKNFLDN